MIIFSFYEERDVSVLLTGYNPQLFLALSKSGNGRWDPVKSVFVFPKGDKSGEILDRIFSGFPRVKIDGDSGRIKIFGFFGRPWLTAPKEDCRIPARGYAEDSVLPDRLRKDIRLTDSGCLINALPLPDRFPAVWADKLEAELRSRKYSRNTVDSYLYYNRQFCRRIQKSPEMVTKEDIRNYLAYLDKSLDLSASSMNLAISSLKFFYIYVFRRKDIIQEQRRPRHDKKLPAVLSRSEIQDLLDCEKNPKHRLLLMLAYSSGLRVSEVVAIKKEHIDFGRKMLLIRTGKGRKDRYTLLSERAANFIHQYCALYSVESWLFPGLPASRHLSIRTAQVVFNKALEKAGITKQTSIHGLRHTFATHLLESGTDIRYIQELLGHASVRTTQRYAHIARRQVLRIRSPLDDPASEDQTQPAGDFDPLPALPKHF
jgi:site-specific recombinase XerD